MATLTKEQIFGADDLKTAVVKTPEWGGEVIVRSMSAAERDDYEQSMVSARGEDEKANLRNVRARMVAFVVVDEHGKRLFSESDIEALGAKSARVVSRVFRAAARLNAFSEADVDELAKNSDAGPSAASSSSSPES